MTPPRPSGKSPSKFTDLISKYLSDTASSLISPHFLCSLISTPLLPPCSVLPADPALALPPPKKALLFQPSPSYSLSRLTPYSSCVSQPTEPRGSIPDSPKLRGRPFPRWSTVLGPKRHYSNCLLPAGTSSFWFTPVSPPLVPDTP